MTRVPPRRSSRKQIDDWHRLRGHDIGNEIRILDAKDFEVPQIDGALGLEGVERFGNSTVYGTYVVFHEDGVAAVVAVIRNEETESRDDASGLRGSSMGG